MNFTETGYINENSDSPKNETACVHQRVVNPHFNGQGHPTGNVVCRECGAVVPDPAKFLRAKRLDKRD